MMTKTLPLLAVLVLLFACTERGEIAYGTSNPVATVHPIWAASFRSTEGPEAGQRSAPRPEQTAFERHLVSVPPTHQTGNIEWPAAAPNAATDFVTLDSETFGSINSFATTVKKADVSPDRNTLLFVHGYNYTHGEAVYQLAQIVHDFEVPAPAVVFSWPSAAQPVGYLYDRDSVLIARDALQEVILALTKDPSQRLTILGHSMGNLLIMETLRQMEISGRVRVADRVEELIMVSPDIDGELFYTQASRLSALPRPTVILAAKQDRALRISAMLTGRTNRLGSEVDRRAVRDLPITVIDASELSTGGTSHSVAFTSPAAIAILKRSGPRNLPGNTNISGPQQVINLADFR